MINLQELAGCFINGDWSPSSSGAVFNIYNPATAELLGTLPDCTADDAVRAVQSAYEAFAHWSVLPAKERSHHLKIWAQAIVENQLTLAEIMTLECGKPIREAMGEVLYTASYIEWFAEEAKRVRGDTIPHPSSDRRLFALKQPVGVCTAITPWNYPLVTLARKCAPALATGCTMVLKPAEATPYSALALARLAQQSGIPDGVINVVTTNRPEEVGQVLTTHPLVRKISFTGSTTVGKKLLKQAADTVKKATMELGGNAPFIVFDDASLDKAVKGAMASKYRNTGQTCACANRFLVQKNIANDFATQLAEASKKLIVGPGMEADTEQGPLINQAALNKVERLVQDAKNKGAMVLTGGERHRLGGLYYQPTVIFDASCDMQLFNEEIFGPVAAIYTFETEAEAIQMANDTAYGLSAYLFTENLSRMLRVSEALQYGMVGVNEGVLSSEMAPFGGVKESGLGREGSHYGIDEYLEVKYLCLGGLE
ncbi:MAG: NAD-dependent succinate-semialdehyde dehydrogenase [Reinekea sp.]|jgi:succinate-semialdehyde dehydrogenase / glutarate-semialdehyde dehydrogenase